MSHIFALHDSDENLKKKGAFNTNLTHAIELNRQGYGIFVTVNDFKHGVRRISELLHINAWAIDLDIGDKEAMVERLRGGLMPSMVVETKRGYQAYWRAKNATPESWNLIQCDRLVPFYGADNNARDIARILRMPGFYHKKDPKDPFLVKKVWTYEVSYTEQDMLQTYKDANADKKREAEYKKMLHETRDIKTYGTGFWDKLHNLECDTGLLRLSGKPCVGMETYSFRDNRSGTRQIYVNEKSTSCWIDANKRIGSFDKGGPGLYQWLRWYNNTPKEIHEIIKKEFPECLI